MKPECNDLHFFGDVETLVNLEEAGMIAIDPSSVTKKRLKVRRTGREGRRLKTTLPRETFERETRRRDLTPEELVLDRMTNSTSIDQRIRDLVVRSWTTKSQGSEIR